METKRIKNVLYYIFRSRESALEYKWLFRGRLSKIGHLYCYNAGEELP